MISINITNNRIEVCDFEQVVPEAYDALLQASWSLEEFCAEFPYIDLPNGLLNLVYEPGSGNYHLNTRDGGLKAFKSASENHYLNGIERNMVKIKKAAIKRLVAEQEKMHSEILARQAIV